MMQAISFLLSLALVAAPADPLLAGLDAFHQGDYAAAERNLRTAVAQGGDPRASAFLALTLAATGRCQEAEAGLSAAYRAKDPAVSKLAGLAQVQCHLSLNRLDAATAIATELKAKYPADADVLYQNARLHMRAWNDLVYQLYQKAPASFRVNQLSGEILETQGQFNEAVVEYRKAIEKSPRSLNLHFRLGRAMLMASHEPEALAAATKEFEAELGLNPADSIAMYQLGQILMVQQKPQEAATRFQQALALNPEFSEVLIALGKLRLEEKKNDEAIALLQRAVKLAPRSEAAHYSLMMAYRNAGRTADARREKAELDQLQKAPEGEFTEFLKKLGEKPPEK